MCISEWRSDVCSADLIFFEPLVNGREQRLQILSRAFLALLEARLGAFEKRLLRLAEHRLPDLAELRGQRRLRVLEMRDLRIVRSIARLMLEMGKGSGGEGVCHYVEISVGAVTI